MSRRYRYHQLAPWIALAFGLCVIAFASFALFYSKGYQAADQRHEAESAARDSAQQDYKECVAKPTATEAVECYKDAEKASSEAQRAQQDLNAQREMADWAESMLWATSIIGTLTLIVTGIGVYYVRDTLEATRKGTAAATAAAVAAQKANSLVLAEQRPWVVLERAAFECDFTDYGHGGTCSWRYHFNNISQSPAVRVFAAVKVYRAKFFEIDIPFRAFVEESRKIANSRDGRIVLPGIGPEGGITSWCSTKYEAQGDHFFLMVCVTYPHAAGLGLEGQLFDIQHDQSIGVGPQAHRLLRRTHIIE